MTGMVGLRLNPGIFILSWTRFQVQQNLACARTSLLLKVTCHVDSYVQFDMLLISYVEVRGDVSQKAQIELISDLIRRIFDQLSCWCTRVHVGLPL
jgi:hypothetical protein